MRVVIVDYGAGNVQSVSFALDRLGAEAVLSNNGEEIRSADKVIFPGVGAAGSAINRLRNCGLEAIIPMLSQPVLGICLGMQLMCDWTDEDNTRGLGIFPLSVTRFETHLKVPHMGWNSIDKSSDPLWGGTEDQDFAYFVHSYKVPDSQFSIGTCAYDGKFAAAIRKGNFYAFQFHPEKSGVLGSRILGNFLKI